MRRAGWFNCLKAYSFPLAKQDAWVRLEMRRQEKNEMKSKNKCIPFKEFRIRSAADLKATPGSLQ